MIRAAKLSPIGLQRYLGGLTYPAAKTKLLDRAKEKGAPREIIGLIGRLPDREFVSPADVSFWAGQVLSRPK